MARGDRDAARPAEPSVGACARTAFRNRSLRRVLVAFLLFNTQEYAIWIAVALFAFDMAAPRSAGLVAVAQLVPAALIAPFAAVLGDRMRRDPGRSRSGYAVQAVPRLACGVALAFGACHRRLPAAIVERLRDHRDAARRTTPVARLCGDARPSSRPPTPCPARWRGSARWPGRSWRGGHVMAWSGPGGAVLAMAVVAAASALVALGIQAVPRRGGRSRRARIDVRRRSPRRTPSGSGGVRRGHPAGRRRRTVLDGRACSTCSSRCSRSTCSVRGRAAPACWPPAWGSAVAPGRGRGGGLVGVRRLAPAVRVALPARAPALARAGPGDRCPLAVVVLGAQRGRDRPVRGLESHAAAAASRATRRAGAGVRAQEALQMVGLAVGAGAAPVLVASFGTRGALAAAARAARTRGARRRRHACVDRCERGRTGARFVLLRVLDIFRAASAARAGAARRGVACPCSRCPARSVIREGEAGDRVLRGHDGDVAVTKAGRPRRRRSVRAPTWVRSPCSVTCRAPRR